MVKARLRELYEEFKRSGVGNTIFDCYQKPSDNKVRIAELMRRRYGKCLFRKCGAFMFCVGHVSEDGKKFVWETGRNKYELEV